MYCLWCDQEIIIDISWENLLKPTGAERLCHQCRSHLKIIKGDRCIKCSRSHVEKLCHDCKRWGSGDPIVFNYSIYTYNDRMQEMIAKWKYRGDYILGTSFKGAFLEAFYHVFSFLNKDTYIVPIPLSKERMLERGFNQAKVLADFLPLKQTDVLKRTYSEKQSKKTRRERISMKNPFILKRNINKPVILVDDIYTTGTTLRHAGNLLKKKGCPKVYAYTLIRG